MADEIIKFDGRKALESILLGELKQIIYTENAPYIKFVLLMTSIEYLGASFDTFPYNETGHSEDRFNNALKKLFPNKYNEFANQSNDFYFYDNLRCGLVHQFRPMIPEILLTTRNEAKKDGNLHLEKKDGNIYLILEDFYDDLETAVNNLIKMSKNGKTPSRKLDNDFIQVYKSNSGTTQQ
jgi:hypothetical protein